jgi:C4-dicarboxylate-specific signal transduction histidine kinase
MSDRFSLRWRIPAVMALILIGAVLTLSALAYSAARRAAIAANSDRLTFATAQMATLTSTQIGNLVRQAQQIAADSEIVGAVRNPGRPLSPRASELLRRLRTDTNSQIQVSVLDREGRPVE